MDRKKAIRTTEATDRSLIPAVHSALVVGTQGHAFIEKYKKAEKEKIKEFISGEKRLSTKA